MYHNDFEGPPLFWSILSIVGGMATAIALIWVLELSDSRQQTVDFHKSVQISK